MIINQAALKRQITVLVLMIFIILSGAYSYSVLPREAAPDITIPFVFVTTTYEGVAPQDMETLVTIPIERKLKGLSGVEEITSLSDDGVSNIAIKFLPGENIDDALQKVRDKVDQAKPDLPDDLPDEPVITEANFSEFPILQVVLSGPFSLKRLKTFAEEFEDLFEAVPGVLDAEILGGLDREIHVEFDLDRMKGYRMPVQSLLEAVSQGNVNMPGGSMNLGEAKYLVRVPEEFDTPAEISSIVAFMREGRPVYLRDIAAIRDTHKEPDTKSRINGEQSVTVVVTKRSGENIIRIVDAVREIVERERYRFPPSLNIAFTADEAEDVKNMVADLENNILSGLVLVLAVVFVFIGGRSALFVSLSIPFSMLITFGLLYAFGITMNMVVLFSLTLALGMLVDNGIVVVENIYRHMQEGKSRLQAAKDGADEVAWPVITSTLTTLGAFFPMIFWPDIMGEFMSYLPKTVIMALAGSLFVALVINPVLSARFQTIRGANFGHEGAAAVTNAGLFKRIYRSVLRWSLRHRGIIVITAFAMLIGSIYAFGKHGAGVEFFPDVEPKRAYVRVKAPVGTNLEATDDFVRQVEAVVADYEDRADIRYVISSVGSQSGDNIGGGGKGTHLAEVTLDFVKLRERSRPSSTIVNELRDTLQEAIQGAEVRVEKPQDGPPTGSAVNLEIYGEDLKPLGDLAENVRKSIENVPGLVDLKDNLVRGKPEIRVEVDKEKAALLGLDAYDIAYTVKTAINGTKVGVYREGKDEYDIVAILPPQQRNSFESLQQLTVAGPAAEPIPLTSLASIGFASGLGGINRIDQKRVVTISADVSGRLAGEVIADIEAIIGKMEWPRGYSYSFTGEQKEQAKAQSFLSRAFVTAIFIIFLVLVTQFNSAMTPFIILTSVILSMIGVFLGLLITGMPFGVIMTGVGVISLAGVVVNNAIVLIDYFNQLKARGLASTEALVQAGMTRFRPVLLTAITTILGLLPMATGISYNFIDLRWEIGGESSQWWGSMAVAVIFGLTVATLLTLVVVPVLCSIQDSIVAFGERRAERKRARRAAKAKRKAEKRAAKARRKAARMDERLESGEDSTQ